MKVHPLKILQQAILESWQIGHLRSNWYSNLMAQWPDMHVLNVLKKGKFLQSVWNQHVSSRIEDMTTSQLLDQAQAMIKERTVSEEMDAASITPVRTATDKFPTVKCYWCFNLNHLSKYWPIQREDIKVPQPWLIHATMPCFLFRRLSHFTSVCSEKEESDKMSVPVNSPYELWMRQYLS